MRAVGSVLLALTLIFFALRVLPGDPAEALLGQEISAEAAANLRGQMGLDRPALVQYGSYLAALCRGDLGSSISLGKTVASLLWDMFPFTLVVVLGGLGVGIALGIPLGMLSAVKRNRLLDYVARIISLGGISLPSFVIAVLLILAFAVNLRWFPITGGGNPSSPVSLAKHGILPAIAVGLGLAAYLTRISRSAMLETLYEDYIRTAYSKGLTDLRVLYKHALRNAMIPILTFLGIYLITMVGESIAVEIAFSRPGLGRLIYGGITQRDYPLIQSLLVIYVAFAALVNLLVDIGYAMVDPRVKVS